MKGIPAEVKAVLPLAVRRAVEGIDGALAGRVEEIRLRHGRPLMICDDRRDYVLTARGAVTAERADGLIVGPEELAGTLEMASEHSLYAFDEEIRGGYITIQGGYRLGLVGRAVVRDGGIKTIRDVSGINIRIARERPGCADALLPYLLDRGFQPLNTLILSPPGAGKTTLLRDIVRQLSDGIPRLGVRGFKVGLVDERSEVAGCHRGIPQRDVGLRTDVLDGCPKAQGMMLMIRAMSPRILATDEIGRPEDVAAVEEAVNSGVALVVTAHGSSLEDLRARPSLGYLLERGLFKRLVLLGRSRGPGTVEAIFGPGGEDIRSKGEGTCSSLQPA